MEYSIFFLGWYLLGFISFALIIYFVDKTLTYRDLLYAFLFGLFGIITFLAVVNVILKELNIINWIKQNINLDKRIL